MEGVLSVSSVRVSKFLNKNLFKTEGIFNFPVSHKLCFCLTSVPQYSM